jgi:hypothetical protein
VHAVALAAAVAPTQQRLLAIGGSSRDATLPSGFARPVENSDGRRIQPDHVGAAGGAGHDGLPGDVYPDVLASEDRSLDLLAVRNIIVHDDEFPSPETFEASGDHLGETTARLLDRAIRLRPRVRTDRILRAAS